MKRTGVFSDEWKPLNQWKAVVMMVAMACFISGGIDVMPRLLAMASSCS